MHTHNEMLNNRITIFLQLYKSEPEYSLLPFPFLDPFYPPPPFSTLSIHANLKLLLTPLLSLSLSLSCYHPAKLIIHS